MSTIDNDLSDEERAKLHEDAAGSEPKPERTPTADDVMAMIKALPDLGVVPRARLDPVLDAIAATDPLERDQLVAELRTKVRRTIKAGTIDEAIATRCNVVLDDDVDGSESTSTTDNGDADEASAEEMAKITRRCMEDGRSAIFCGHDEAATVDKAIEALIKRAPWIFSRDGRLVTVRNARIVELSVENVRYTLNRVATFVDAQHAKLKLIVGPPHRIDAMVHARGIYPGMRELVGVATTPILHSDGSTFTTPGEYDPETQQVYVPAHRYPAIPEALPTLAEAKVAAAEVLEMFADFPARERCDRAAILALVLTMVGRRRVGGPAPAFVVVANAPRVGKGKLVATAGAISYGTMTSVIPQQKSDEELEKKIVGLLRAGRRHIAFDNLMQFGGPLIDALLTSTAWDGRTLGTSEVGTYDVSGTVITATANNMRYVGDAAQRVLPIRLHTDSPHPELLEFERKLPDAAIRDHVRLHVAALTVLRYGLTLTGTVKTWGSFERWCVIRRTVIEVLGADPCDTRTEDDAADETAQVLAMLLEAIYGLGAGMEWTATQLLEKARGKRDKREEGKPGEWIEQPNEALNEALSNLLGDLRRAPVNVAHALNPHKGRKVDLGGGCLAALASRKLHGVVQWSVKMTVSTTGADPEGTVGELPAEEVAEAPAAEVPSPP